MTITIAPDPDQLHNLNLSPAQTVIENLLQEGRSPTSSSCVLRLISQEPGDPRELPEIPEVRLWFICLDSRYPWLPFLLDWKAGNLPLHRHACATPI